LTPVGGQQWSRGKGKTEEPKWQMERKEKQVRRRENDGRNLLTKAVIESGPFLSFIVTISLFAYISSPI